MRLPTRTHAAAAAIVAGALGAASAQPFCETYTTCPQFNLGVLAGAAVCQNDGVTLSSQVSTFPVLWLANASEDSVSKWDTTLNREVGRYGTWYFGVRPAHGSFSGPAPSRTTVDLDGNVFVANRHFDNRPASVMKILNTGFVDRNNNNIMDTATDTNNNGIIDPAEQLYHVDSNNNGILETSELRDERIAWIVQVGPANGLGRCLAIDASGDVWLGLFNSRQFWKIDGDTGAILGGPYPTNQAPIGDNNNTPYGAFVDRDGFLWAATLNNRILKFNTNVGSEGLVQTIFHNSGLHNFSNYGITGARRNPDNLGERTFAVVSPGGGQYREYDAMLGTFSNPSLPSGQSVNSAAVSVDGNGNVLAGDISNVRARKFGPTGALIWATNTSIVANRATIADANNDAWRIDTFGSRMQKLDGTTGAVINTVLFGPIIPTGREPYTYSDATGISLQTSFPQGTWTASYDSGCVDTCWDTISWNEIVPPGTVISVRARTSNDQLAWSPYQAVANAGALTVPNGRYIQWEVRLQVLAGNLAPVLEDLTVCGTKPYIGLDIYPNRTPNPVYLSRDYTLYVAVLGNAKTDVTLFDWTTARFGPTGTEASATRAPTFRDINGDTFMDALYGFRTSQCGFALGHTSGTFSINTPGGCPISQTDSVQVNP